MSDPMEDIETDGKGNVIRRTAHAPDSAVFKARRKAQIEKRLLELDAITGPRWAEALHRQIQDQFILSKLDEKDALREERRLLDK